MTNDTEIPTELVDREAEADLLGSVFAAVLALDSRPDHAGAREVLEDFARFDVTWICSRDLARVASAMQVVQRDEGAPIPLAVCDVLQERRHFEELRHVLPMLVTRSAAVISGWSYYVKRVGEVCARRREYLAHVGAAADLLAEGVQR